MALHFRPQALSLKPAALTLALACALMLASIVQAAPIPTLSNAAANARLAASADTQYADIWDIYLSSSKADKSLLKSWFKTEIDEVLSSEQRTVIRELKVTGKVKLIQGEHLNIVVKKTTSADLAKAEHFAYELSDSLDLDLVPTTGTNSNEVGQLFIGNAKTADEADLGTNDLHIFDRLITNTDRHGENYLITEAGNTVLIDHEDGVYGGSIDGTGFSDWDYGGLFPSEDNWKTFNQRTPPEWKQIFTDSGIPSDDYIFSDFLDTVEDIKADMEDIFKRHGKATYFRQIQHRASMAQTRNRQSYASRQASRSSSDTPLGSSAYSDGCEP